jgi:tripartite-type tricarboxylate transporter receptor subunit TctC
LNASLKKSLALTLVAAATATASMTLHAQDFPAGKPITIVVPFAAGGPTDRVARDLAEAMRKPLDGVSIVIDNAAGAGSTIGNAKVARAKADGYTLLLTHVGMATTPVLYRKLPYNYETDFEYLGMINDVPMTVIGKPQLEANNSRNCASGSRRIRARPTWATPASARPRTCAACCSRAS